MARGRMIKPELWTSKRINKVSLESNLLFIALLNFCDDFGTIQDSNRMILGNCFPYRENVTEKMIEKWKSELIEVELLAKIEHQGKNLLAVVKWEKHQTIMNRSKRNNIDNDLNNQDVIDTIETLISNSLGSNYPIDNRQETNNKGKETKEKREDKPSGLLPVYFQFMILGLTPDKALAKADKFYSHYQSNGWKVSKNPMKDWKAATSGTWCDFTKVTGFQKDHLCFIIEELEKQYADRKEHDQFDFAKLKHSRPDLFSDPDMFNNDWNKYLEEL